MVTMVDMFPVFLRKGHRKTIFTGIVCLCCFLLGLCMVTEVSCLPFAVISYNHYVFLCIVITLITHIDKS